MTPNVRECVCLRLRGLLFVVYMQMDLGRCTNNPQCQVFATVLL